MSVFTFKQFEIKQERSAMKIGTDSVLLGCFCEVSDAHAVLDIGTGTGLLALMLAQKSHARIDAVEYDQAAAQEATGNFSRSPWSDRLFLHHQAIQDFVVHHPQKYDVIISNPPYYKAGSNVFIEDEQRSRARHGSTLSFSELAGIVARCLHAEGSFWLILPAAEAALFNKAAAEEGLHVHRCIRVVPKLGQQANRFIMQLGLTKKQEEEETFVVYHPDGSPSEAYKQVARHFYTGPQFRVKEDQ